MGEITSQEDFNLYMRKLPMKEECQFVVHKGMNLCNDERFICPYRSDEKYALRTGIKKECRREKLNQLKKILGSSEKYHQQRPGIL